MVKTILKSCVILVALLGIEASTPVAPSREYAAVSYTKDTALLRYAEHYGISYRVAELVVRYANKWHIPHDIAFRLVQRESRFDTLALNSQSSAAGLTQVVLPTARRIQPGISREDLLVPETALDIGFRFLHNMHRRYRGDWWRALVAYHDGPGVADTLDYGFHIYADNILR